MMRAKVVHFVFVVGIAYTAAANARDMKGRMVPTGIAFAQPNTALFTNPASLTDAASYSLQGTYLKDPSAVHTSLVGSLALAGFGIGFRNIGDNSTVEAGVGLNLGWPKIGVVLRSNGAGENVDGDVGLNFDLVLFRLGLVARSIEDKIDRLDASFGFSLGSSASLAIDVKKPRRATATGSDWTHNQWLLDFSVGVSTGLAGISVGYDVEYTGDALEDGEAHAGLSFAFDPSVVVEAAYRPMAQEWAAGEWTLGLRYQF